MFNEIWKKNILKPSSKVGIFKPKMGFELEEDDDNCNRQLKEYANKIKNVRLPFEDSWDSKEMEYYRDFMFRKIFDEKDEKSIYFSSAVGNHRELAVQSKTHIYNPVPESVACETLEILKKQNIGSVFKHKEIDGYDIWVFSEDRYDQSILQTMVKHNDSILIQLILECANTISMFKAGKMVFSFERNDLNPARNFKDASRYNFNIDWR
tara:strand:+ start:60 stop:686 length:627 start_codon:yes stop_codon:yes gene_type:complete